MKTKKQEIKKELDRPLHLAHSFWKEYIGADEFERLEKLESPAKLIDGLKDMNNNKFRLHSIKTLLKSYFDDLIEFMEVQNALWK